MHLKRIIIGLCFVKKVAAFIQFGLQFARGQTSEPLERTISLIFESHVTVP